MNYLENTETLLLDDNILQIIDSVHVDFGSIFEWKDVDVPVIVSLDYVSYTSALKFSVRLAGRNMKEEKISGLLETGEPLTLTRF